MKNSVIFYKKPALRYLDAMPVGNGHLGAMVCGGTATEKINLNDDTLWSGFPRPNYIDNAYDRFTVRLRKKILEEGDYYAAEDLADRLQGHYNESYISAGELLIDFDGIEEVCDYIRGLDMRNGVAFTSFSAGGTNFKREVFASAPDKVIVVHLTSDKKASATVSLDSMIRHTNSCTPDGISLCGRAPRHIEAEYLEYTSSCREAIVYDEVWERQKGLRFECHARAVSDGACEYKDGKIFITDAKDTTIYLFIATNFNPDVFSKGHTVEDYCFPDMDITSVAEKVLDDALTMGYEKILSRHISDMNEYFDRVDFAPEYDKALDELPTDERKKKYSESGKDAGFEKQLFDFGRYLLYSCSRPGTQAANLQGIWCWQMRPAWSCNYTININTQMNYWGVEIANMPECHLPLMDFLNDISYTGKDTASGHYNARGFCAHHNVDMWRSTIPVGEGETNCMWSIFPTGGLWLSLHVWDHYLFTEDVEFLKKYYHILKGSALFAIDMMCDMGGGVLGICPATVPEHRYKKPDGTVFAVGAGSTFDYELVTELFDYTKTAASLVGDDDADFIAEMENVIKHIPPIPVDSKGEISDWQFECEPSPYLWLDKLYGLYPGFCLTQMGDNVLAAAKKTLDVNDQTTNSFGNCWYSGAWSRIGRADKAYEKLEYHFKHGTFDSLLGLNTSYPESVFQIDSNLGIVAAVGEMLIHSTPSKIILLPALPQAWQEGNVKGLRTRCGCAVCVEWEKGMLKKAIITSEKDRIITVSNGVDGKEKKITLAAGVAVEVDSCDFE